MQGEITGHDPFVVTGRLKSGGGKGSGWVFIDVEEIAAQNMAIALGMGVGMKFARGDGGGEDDRGADGVLAAMDRLGSGARAKARRDEALIAEARALGRAVTTRASARVCNRCLNATRVRTHRVFGFQSRYVRPNSFGRSARRRG